MKVYLVNKNPIITKIVSLGAIKIDLEMVETKEIDPMLQADVLIIDDECYQEESLGLYQEFNAQTKIILLHTKSIPKIEGFDRYIQKPFLPTELVRELAEISKTLDSNLIEEDFIEDFAPKARKDNQGTFILPKDEIDEVKNLLEENKGDSNTIQQKDSFSSEVPLIFGRGWYDTSETLRMSIQEEMEEYGEIQSNKNDFDNWESLSLEGISEALEEPITKAPKEVSIIPEDEVFSRENPPLHNLQINSLEAFVQMLQTLQTQNLKDLLSGATINISIQFPKKED